MEYSEMLSAIVELTAALKEKVHKWVKMSVDIAMGKADLLCTHMVRLVKISENYIAETVRFGSWIEKSLGRSTEKILNGKKREQEERERHAGEGIRLGENINDWVKENQEGRRRSLGGRNDPGGDRVQGNITLWALFVFMSLSPSMVFAVKCPPGTHLYTFNNGQPGVCVECQPGTFMPATDHQETKCKSCEKVANNNLEILVSPCNQTHGSVIHCVDGYYRDLARNPRETGTCRKCTECSETGLVMVKQCNTYRDSICCLDENFDVVPNHNGDLECRGRSWFCRRGQYFENGGFRCVECPSNTFMPVDYHVHSECFRCANYIIHDVNSPLHSVITQPCNSTHDTVLRCQDGFLINHNMGRNGDSIGCSPCTDCSATDVQFEGRKCDSMKDTACCPQANMTVIDEPNGHVCMGPSSICNASQCLRYRSSERSSACVQCQPKAQGFSLPDVNPGDGSEHKRNQASVIVKNTQNSAIALSFFGGFVAGIIMIIVIFVVWNRCKKGRSKEWQPVSVRCKIEKDGSDISCNTP